MIGYSKLAAKVWSLVEQRRIAFGNNGEACVQDMDRINTEINEWYRSVPAEVQITQDWRREGPINATSSYNLQRLRVWTYLRLNQVSFLSLFTLQWSLIVHTTDPRLALCTNPAYDRIHPRRTGCGANGCRGCSRYY